MEPLPNEWLPPDEIFRRLKEFNVDCGPITSTTRRVWVKKLNKLESERNKRTNVTPVVSTNNGHHDETPSHLDYSIQQIDESPIIDDRNGDDSQIAQTVSTNQTTIDHTSRIPKSQSYGRHSPRRKTNEELDAIRSFNAISKQMRNRRIEEETPQKTKPERSTPIVKTINLNDTRSPALNRYSDISESESEDDLHRSVSHVPSVSNTLNTSINPRRPQAQIYTGESHKPVLTRPPIRRTTIVGNKVSSLLAYSDSESDNEELRNDKLCKMLLSHRPGLGRITPKGSKPSMLSQVFGWLGLFKKQSKLACPTSHSSATNLIPQAIIIFTVLFLLSIFSIYFYKLTQTPKHTLDLTDYSFIEDKSKLVAPICALSTDSNCLQYESDRKHALNMVKEIKAYLDFSIYQKQCESYDVPVNYTELRFKQDDILRHLESKNYNLKAERNSFLFNATPTELLKRDMNNAVILIKLNPSWNIKTSAFAFDDEFMVEKDYVVNLPVKCQLSLIWRANWWPIVITGFTVLLSTSIFAYYSYRKRVASQEQSLVYELIEKSIELLQSPDEPQSMPVLHIRDTLLSASERKSAKYKRIWKKVVEHIEKAESRVKMEWKTIDGEDFKAWKWIASNSMPNFMVNDNESDLEGSLPPEQQSQKIGGVEWQGQAFAAPRTKESQSETDPKGSTSNSSIYPTKNFQALTRFMKIRNMFNKEAQCADSNWSRKIRNSILEKTATATKGSHDIVHMEIDDASTPEGLVYLKCGSIAGATNAFNALHGWWCEKKLVSVKFLKEERYYARFPHASEMNTPLKMEPID